MNGRGQKWVRRLRGRGDRPFPQLSILTGFYAVSVPGDEEETGSGDQAGHGGAASAEDVPTGSIWLISGAGGAPAWKTGKANH